MITETSAKKHHQFKVHGGLTTTRTDCLLSALKEILMIKMETLSMSLKETQPTTGTGTPPLETGKTSLTTALTNTTLNIPTPLTLNGSGKRKTTTPNSNHTHG
jgi:hypothetical protein